MKIKFVVLFFMLTIINGCVNSEIITGYWTGSMEVNGKTVDMSIDLKQTKKLFSSYDLMLLDQPISNLKLINRKITFLVNLDIDFVFHGEIKNNQITGNAAINGGPPNMDIAFSLTKQSELPVKTYSIESLTIKSNDVILSAEIYTPKTEGLHPAIVLLQGSSTNLKTDYLFDADFFAKLGFEVLIFDKRGNGKSTGEYYSSGYNDLITDAIACLETMYSRKSVDKNKIGLWGYSQGGMLLPKIVAKTSIPHFLIAKSPEIISETEAAAFSDSLRVVNSGYTDSDGHLAAESHRKIEKMIRKGSDYKDVEKFIRQNAQKYNFMNQTGLYGSISIDKNEFNGFYWKGRTENFYSDWKNTDVSTLVLLGERDDLINAEKSEAIIKGFNNDNVIVKLFPRANHHLKKTFNPRVDSEFDWPRITEGYSELVKNWIQKEVKK
ncbi:alpha/beta hydrolase family protein [Maribellus comscasis]|nr:alpha/beta fold hydrolase [Maribellus comscasis]